MATLGTVLVTVAVAYLAICLLLWLFQERMLFLPGIPGRAVETTPQALRLSYEEVAMPTADGVRLHGWWVPAPGARHTLLHLHGNAGNISHRLELLQIFHAIGVNVLLFDYRGYGRSDGEPSEAGLRQDAEAAWTYLTEQRGITPATIVIHGQSMGGAFAAWLAARRQPAALALESAFTSVPDMAAHLYGWLPARWLARLELDTLGALAEVRCPVLVIHSSADEIIPYAHGEKLFAAAREPKRQLTIGGDHNAGFWVSRDAYAAGWRDFLATLPAGPAP
jgi:fermentation-respiration switch protein FrsA (DUF1100 family)